jgi:hypothetical protein
MINIADNPLIRSQVKKADSVAPAPAEDNTPTAVPSQPTYPAKSMVLEGGRYYVALTEK